MTPLLIKNIQVADTTSPHNDKIVDLFIDKGIIQKIGSDLNQPTKKTIDGTGKYIAPGWVSLFSDLCEPGNEQYETITTGLNAAANGGFSQIILVPNTNPALSTRVAMEFAQQESKGHAVNLHIAGAISKDIEGKNLAEMLEMHYAGAVAFTDGWKPLQDPDMMQKALEYVKIFDGIIIQLPFLASMSSGLMNEGPESVKLGMPGIPSIAESLIVHRDIELTRYTHSKIHFSGVSTAESLKLIKKAKKEGVAVSCSVTPYHLLYTDAALELYDSLYKVNPPLRSEADRKALLAGLEDGTIDAIATHHKPVDWDGKTKEFEYAKSGMAALETCWPMLLKAAPKVAMNRWAALLSTNIRQIFKLESATIAEGHKADFTLFDKDSEWQLDENNKSSLAYNIPLINVPLKGKATII